MSDPTPNPVLDQLGAELAGLEASAAPTPPAPGAPGAPAPVDYQAECSMLVSFAFDTLAPFYPATCAAWSAEKRAALVAACVPLATKYGFTLGGLFDRWGPEVGLALVVVPMIGPTMAGLRADRQAAQAAPAAPSSTPPGPAGGPAHPAPPPPPSGEAVATSPRFNVEGVVIGA